MKITIPKSKYCNDCYFINENEKRCELFGWFIIDDFKCKECLNKEPIIIEYQGEKEDEK
jgi:hypothetical protein